MIQAELKRKIGVDGRSASDRMEDILTSNVFGLLRYLPADSGILRWFGLATSMGAGERLDAVSAPDLHFWPRLGDGEVDLLAVLPLLSGQVDLVAIECKYRSGKSGCASGAPEGEEKSHDQLAKYAVGLRAEKYDQGILRGRAIRRSVILYVTADAAPPIAALEESLRALEDPGWCDRFFWVGWEALHDPLRCLETDQSVTGIVARDLRTLLESKRLRPFEGFGSLSPPAASAGPAWRSRWCHRSPLCQPPGATVFRREG